MKWFTWALSSTWLQARRRAQLATTGEFNVFHGFTFTDERERSGIGFRHRIVDDAGRTYKAAHYDHGSGVAVAAVLSDEFKSLAGLKRVGIVLSGGNADLDHLPW